MGNAVWVRAALIGREIIGVNGEKAVIADFGDTGVMLESRGTGRSFLVPMQAITATIQHRGERKRSPHLEDLVGLGLDETHASFLVPLIVAIRTVPGMEEWLQGVSQTMAEMH
jgi:hypothetical protein